MGNLATIQSRLDKLENIFKLVPDSMEGAHHSELTIDPMPYSDFVPDNFVTDDTPLGGTVSIKRVLTTVLAGLKKKRMSMLPFYDGTVVPFGQAVGLADRTVASLFFEGSADAQFIGPNTENLLNSSMTVGEDLYPVRVMANEYILHYIDMMSAERALRESGEAYTSLKAEISRRGIAEKLNNYSAFGDATFGGGSNTGFMNNAAVPLDNANAYDPYTSATAQDDIDFIRSQVNIIINNQNLNSSNIVMYVPQNTFIRWSTRYDTTFRASVLQTALESLGPSGLEAIIPLNECQRGPNSTNLPDNVGTAGRDRFVTTVRDSMFYSQHASPLSQWPQVQISTGYKVPLWQAMTPCMFHNVTGTIYTDIVVQTP